MSKHFTILGLPVEAGCGRSGCLMGPDSLRSAGLCEDISDLGGVLSDLGNMVQPSSIVPSAGPAHLKKLPEIVAWTQHIQALALDLASQDSFPIFLGGDHSMAAGTLSGIAQAAAQSGQSQFVLWLDAHPDLNTLSSSLSGNLHGTPMAYALGLHGFADIFPPLMAPIDPANICMMGLRSVDDAEHNVINELGLEVYDMQRLNALGVVKPIAGFLDRVAAAKGRLHISLDVDFLDPEIAPAVGTTVPGGASRREAHLIMDMICESGLATSLELSELNPYLDVKDKTAALLCDLAGSLLGQKSIKRGKKGG